MRYKAELGKKCLVNLFILKICEYFFNTVESVIACKNFIVQLNFDFLLRRQV